MGRWVGGWVRLRLRSRSRLRLRICVCAFREYARSPTVHLSHRHFGTGTASLTLGTPPSLPRLSLRVHVRDRDHEPLFALGAPLLPFCPLIPPLLLLLPFLLALAVAPFTQVGVNGRESRREEKRVNISTISRYSLRRASLLLAEVQPVHPVDLTELTVASRSARDQSPWGESPSSGAVGSASVSASVSLLVSCCGPGLAGVRGMNRCSGVWCCWCCGTRPSSRSTGGHARTVHVSVTELAGGFAASWAASREG